MEPGAHPRSFSAGRRWGILASVLVSVAAVAAIVLMLNYLGARHFMRFYWSAKTNQKLSPMTVGLLRSITNQVTIILYYDKDDRLYDEIAGLLKEYRDLNSNIAVQSVDYRDPIPAQRIKSTYGLNSAEDKNLLIIACGEKRKIIPGELLATSTLEQVADDPPAQSSGATPRNFVRHFNDFKGESIVDGCLLIVTSAKPLLACYLVGHGEPAIDGQSDLGYAEFNSILGGCNLDTMELHLEGTNVIPAACNLLVIAGPQRALNAEELQKVRTYLAGGGRLLMLFQYSTIAIRTGLESVLHDWGVEVGQNYITDLDKTQASAGDSSIVVDQFNPKHDLVNPLLRSRLLLVMPRSISANPGSGNNAPTVVELAWTGSRGIIHDSKGGSQPAGRVPLMAAVEKNGAHGATRIVVAGDALFLANAPVKLEDNGNFGRLAINWLLDQTPLMQDVGPRQMVEYRVNLTRAQMNSIRWIFLGAMPGGILLLGGLVWLRRRH